MSQLALFVSFEYLCNEATANRTILNLSASGPSKTSESDVHRRQILTYKDSPRPERVEVVLKQDNKV